MGFLSDMKWLVSREWLLCSSQINSFNLTYLVFRPKRLENVHSLDFTQTIQENILLF